MQQLFFLISKSRSSYRPKACRNASYMRVCYLRTACSSLRRGGTWTSFEDTQILVLVSQSKATTFPNAEIPSLCLEIVIAQGLESAAINVLRRSRNNYRDVQRWTSKPSKMLKLINCVSIVQLRKTTSITRRNILRVSGFGIDPRSIYRDFLGRCS